MLEDQNDAAENIDDDFDAAYDEAIGNEGSDETPHDDDTSDQANIDVADDAPAGDTPDNSTPPDNSQDSGAEDKATEAGSKSESSDDQPEDLKALQQKLRSAEGRLSKFEESVEEMRERLKQQAKPADDNADDKSGSDTAGENQNNGSQDKPPVDDANFVPPGMDKDDWLDLQEDYPDTAKALKEKFGNDQKLAKENKELKEDQKKAQEDKEAFDAFRSEILDVHPDYDTAIVPHLEDVQTFIDEQSSAVIKQQYQRIFQAGSAQEINALVTDYKAARKTGSSDSPPPDNPDQSSSPPASKKVDAAMAVPSRGGGNPNLSKGKPDMDDYDSAWDEAEVD